MEEQDYMLIDDYFDGLLDGKARQEVLKRIDSEPAFAAAFATAQKMQEWLRREPARRVFEQTTAVLGQEFFPAENVEKATTETAKIISMTTPAVMRPRSGGLVSSGKAWAIAAAMTLLIAAIWFVMRPQPALYQQFAMHTPPQFTVRSGAANAATTAETLFKKGDYAGALTALQQLAVERPDDPTVAFYTAVCQLELNQTGEARSIFATLANGASAWRAEAQWYVALTWLKENNLEKCKQVLLSIQPGSDRYAAAARLLKKLR